MALQGLRIFQVRSESGFLTDDEILERSRAIASLRQQLEIEAVAAAAAAASDSSNSCLKSATGGGFGDFTTAKLREEFECPVCLEQVVTGTNLAKNIKLEKNLRGKKWKKLLSNVL